ncbi:hypothetical protein J7J62_04700 [bacterium]|nr:hypothetical protein [bacterium]
MKNELGKYDIVLLFSGGLDSLLSAAILKKQGLSVLALKFVHPFLPKVLELSERFYVESQVGVDVLEVPTDEDYLRVILNPRFGYGSNANPCLDCKIHFFRRAWEFAKRVGARGLATGEVLGQRPFSQRRETFYLIEKEAGVSRMVVRPLCAKLLRPSVLEESGIVDRNLLYGISGRSRKRQMELAKQFGIKKVPTPAGGCLLTDPGYAARFFDAKLHGEVDLRSFLLLKVGRHMRIGGVKVVVGRNEHENRILREKFSSGCYVLEPVDGKGPTVLVWKNADDEVVTEAARVLARYVRGRRYVEVLARSPSGDERKLVVESMPEKCVDKLLIGD